MNVGENLATNLKDLSESTNTPFADILWKYAAQDIIYRIEKSGNSEQLWLEDYDYPSKLDNVKKQSINQAGMKNACGSNPRLNLVYYNGRKELSELSEEIISQNTDIKWEISDENVKEDNSIFWILKGNYCSYEIQYPIKIKIIQNESWIFPISGEIEPIRKRYIKIKYNAFSIENMLGKQVFEVINKLELINSMGPYCIINNCLKANSISGRHMIEELGSFIEKEPKVAREKRIDQIKEYRNYSYMKKRWNQYCKKNGIDESWEEVLDRTVSFIEPLWRALCNNEIFFDDWMPELGRFLG